MRYCAYQERCKADIVKKMKAWEQNSKEIEDAIEFLVLEGFVDDFRFAASYVRGKLRSKKWGRNKIRAGLYAKQLDKECIEAAFGELDTEEYENQLLSVLKKKNDQLREDDPYKRKQKLAYYAQSKGYELNLIWDKIGIIINK